jgi:hypothetical protein
MPVLVNILPDHPCDRCGHMSKHHAAPERGSRCMFAEGQGYSAFTKHAQVTGKAQQCWCDGFFPRP